MASDSLDLRERIIKAVERGDQSKREIARLFEVHESFIYKLLRQERALGHPAPLPHGGGHTAKLQEEQFAVLRALVAHTPDATLDELSAQLQRKTGVAVSRTTLWRGLAGLQLTRKKRPKPPPQADPLKRQEFAARQGELPAERLVFVDEFSLHTALTPGYGRAPSGERVVMREPFERERVSVIAALSVGGAGGPVRLAGGF